MKKTITKTIIATLCLLLTITLCLGIGSYRVDAEETETTVYHDTVEIKNSNFETLSTENDTISNWNKISTTETSSGTSSVMEVTGHDEKNSNVLSLSNSEETFFALETDSTFSFDMHSYYLVTVWAKIEQNNDSTYGAVHIFNGSNFLYTKIIQSSDADWKEYKLYIKTDNVKKSYYIALSLGSSASEKASGSILFDDVTLEKISEKEYYQNNTDETTPTNVEGFDGESLSSKIDLGTTGSWINVTEKEYEQYNDLSFSNQKAILIKGSSSSEGVKIKDIKIEKQKITVLSFSVKLNETLSSTNLEITLKEQNGHISTVSYSPFSSAYSVKSTDSNKSRNGFTLYTFFIKGNIFEDSYADLTIKLTEKGKECVIDTIRTELISESDYSSASETTSSSVNVKKVYIESYPSGNGVTNGNFYDVEYIDTMTDSSLLTPKSWTIDGSNKENCGVLFNYTNKSSKLVLKTSSDNTNEITLSSTSFKLSANTYYKLSFNMNSSLSTDSKLVVNFTNTTDNQTITLKKLLYNESFSDKTEQFYIATGSTEINIKVIFTLTNGSSETSSLTLHNISAIEVTEKEAEHSTEMVDLGIKHKNENDEYEYSEYKEFEIVEGSADDDGCYDIKTYQISSNADSTNYYLKSQKASFINGFNPYEFKSEYLLKLTNKINATSTATQIYGTSLSASSFYKIVITAYASKNENDSVQIYFNGISNDENNQVKSFDVNSSSSFTTYTMYVATGDSSKTIKLVAGLTTTSNNESFLYIDDYTITEIDETAFSEIESTSNLSNDNVILSDERDDDEDDEEDDDSSENSNNSDSNSSINKEIWYWIPTALLGVAVLIVIAIVLFKKIKIKKRIQVKNNYNASLRKSQKQREKEKSNLNTKPEKRKQLNERLNNLIQTKKDLENQISSEASKDVNSIKDATEIEKNQKKATIKLQKIDSQIDEINKILSKNKTKN